MTIRIKTIEIHTQLAGIPQNLIKCMTFNLKDAAALANMDQRTFKKHLNRFCSQSKKIKVGLRLNIEDIKKITRIARDMNGESLFEITEYEPCSIEPNGVESNLEDMLK